MLELSIFWLRLAVVFYAAGLCSSLVTIVRREQSFFAPALHAFRVGLILHFVSLVDRAFAVRHFPADNFFETISLCGFLLGLLFVFAQFRYSFSSLGLFLFPLVFGMALVGALGTPVGGWASVRIRSAWLIVHVMLVIAGYASLLIAGGASIFYLVQERQLKAKKLVGGPFGAPSLPALMTLDSLLARTMNLGFVFTTLGVIVIVIWAFIESGTRWISDPTILISMLTWFVYLALIYLRTVAGWRGRRAAWVTLSVLTLFALTWAAHIGILGTVFAR
ncbi:MAG: cytochrome c biogenesis protein [Bryobacteraceae bacterium]|nr:cytochrome c biogenesis protein [Bryobacteraceae bacterium]